MWVRDVGQWSEWSTAPLLIYICQGALENPASSGTHGGSESVNLGAEPEAEDESGEASKLLRLCFLAQAEDTISLPTPCWGKHHPGAQYL